jgi:drug/metabolite transporter superfamily protein YnfA
MKPLARYHLIWSIVLLAVTGIVFGFALAQWLKQGRPPIWHFWAEQMIVVAGAYRAWYHIKAFNAARKS